MPKPWQAARLHFVLGCHMGLIGGESDYACSRKGVYWSRRVGCPEQLSCQAAYHIRSLWADGKNLADEDVTPHRPRRLSYIIHHLSLPRLSSEPKSEWEVYNQVYGVKLTAFLNRERLQMQSTHDNSERLETSLDQDSLCLAEALNAMVIGVHRMKDVPRETVWERVGVCVRKEETREGNRAPGYSANTANPVTLLQARTSPFTERCWERCVSKAPHSSSSLSPPSPFLCGFLRYWKHHGGHGEQQVGFLVDFCLQAQAELKRNVKKRNTIRKEGIKERSRLLGYIYYTKPRKVSKALSSGGKPVTTDVTI